MTSGDALTLEDLAQVLGTDVPTSPGAPVSTEPATAGSGPGGTAVTGVTLDSRRVAHGDLYAALPGANVHGARFAEQAAAAGAVAALTDAAGRDLVERAGLPALVVDDPRAVLGDLASRIFGHPGQALTTVGITGTNGKTTTAYLVESLLRAAGRTTGLLGTVETRIAGVRVDSVRTTPEAPDLHALLARMVAAGVQACALEVSSHALAQHRVDGLVVDVAAFTNLSQDHLDFHGSMAEYFAAKALLFTPQHSHRGVVWVDPADPEQWGRRLAERATVPVTTVGPDGDWRVSDVRTDRARSTFRLTGPEGTGQAVVLDLVCPLPGDFNVANAAVAVVIALTLGLPAATVAEGLAAAQGVPGRMQPVTVDGAPLVVVDYAHTPDALDRVLGTLRTITPGRLVAVFGAGGDRDRGKRPLMGAAVAAAADVAVVTDDNPRSEDAATIRAAVLAGTTDGPARVLEVADRREAVTVALQTCSSAHDTVLLAGKGHETGQESAGVVTPFDDRLVAARALQRWLEENLGKDPQQHPAQHPEQNREQNPELDPAASSARGGTQ